MTKIKLKLNKNCKYVLACSFGPDSMALLDLCLKNNIQIVVAHVNYHKRDVSNFEQDSLIKYCESREISIEVFDTKGIKVQGNFQEWAREARYNFFKSVCEKHNCHAVLVAHQQDDVIETYLMQQQRGNIVKYWGIAEENELFGVKIIRPLLDYTKKELLDYDNENKVPYSIDESNLTDHYTRNKFRHHVVEKMSEEERKIVINEIKEKQTKIFDFKTSYSKEEFLKLNAEEVVSILNYFMNQANEHRDLSFGMISELKKALENKQNYSFKITDSVLLESNYGEINVINANKLVDYEFKFNEKFSNQFIDIDFSENAKDRNIYKTHDLIVRNLKPKDIVEIKNYKVEARRLFIDWKMPNFLRKVWPVICDYNGNILYVPRYKKNFKETHKSVFTINISYFLNFKNSDKQ